MIPSLAGNQFLSGGVAMMALGSVLALCRKVPGRLWEFVRQQYTVSVEARSPDQTYTWLELWLSQIPYSKKARRLHVSTLRNGNDEHTLTVIYSPATGMHWFRYKGRLIWLTRTKEERKGSGNSLDDGGGGGDAFQLTMLSRSQKLMRELIDEVRLAARARDKASLYVNLSDYWQDYGSVPDRTVASVILPDDSGLRVLEDARKFLDASDWYKSLGIPYRRGYLLYGVPGSGKSSLVNAIAAELKLDVYSLSLSSNYFDDERLRGLLMRVGERAVVLLEDVDVALDNARKKDAPGGGATGPSLSGLLNCIDGLIARSGLIICMTTNHRDKLDPALLRPGRVDMEVEFRAATPDQIRRLYQAFYPERTDADAFVESFTEPPCMAEVQRRCLMMKDGWVDVPKPIRVVKSRKRVVA